MKSGAQAPYRKRRHAGPRPNDPGEQDDPEQGIGLSAAVQGQKFCAAMRRAILAGHERHRPRESERHA